MQIGIYCSSKRPQFWGSLHHTLSQNDVDFNLCFAGPYPPVEPLPGNVKYIQTNVKPAQCYFIAANNTTGDYIMPVSDDIILSPGCLDEMVKMINDNKMTIASPFFAHAGDIGYKSPTHYQLWDARGYPEGDPRTTPENKVFLGTMVSINFPLPMIDFMHRETFNQIGIDKGFIATWWNLDLSIELISRGGNVIVSETNYCCDFRGGPDGESLCQIPCDLFYLDDMWIDQAVIGGADKKVRTTRKQPIDPLVYNDTVLTVSQGKVYPPLSIKREYEAGTGTRVIPKWI